MKFVADPLTVAFALGLLGPVAVDEHGLFDDGTPSSAENAVSLAEQAALEQEAEESLTESYDFSFDEATRPA